MRQSTLLVLSLLVLLLAACGADPPPPESDFSLSLSPSSLSTPEGSEGIHDVTVTISRTNLADDVTLSLSGAPAGVTSSFSPATTGGDSSTLTLTVAATTPQGSYPLAVKGTVGVMERTTPLTLNVTAPPTITVSGRVTDLQNEPVANAPVVIFGHTPVTTNVDGEFSVPEVSTPYSVAVVVNTSNAAVVYQGLNRPDPTLLFLDFVPLTPKQATLSGTVSGGAGFPQPANHTVRAAFGSPETSASLFPSGVTGIYNSTLNWFGPSATSGTLHALQWERDGSNLPVSYTGYGKKAGVTLSDGGTFPNQDVILSGVATTDLSASASLPAGYSLSNKSLNIDFGDGADIFLLFDGSNSTLFSYKTPNLTGATMRLSASASKPGGFFSRSVEAGLAPSATDVTLTIPAAPELSLPVDNAINVDTTTSFSWTPFSDGVHVAIFLPAVATQPRYYIFSKDASVTLPDLSAQGLGLASAAAYTWQVSGFAPFANLDAAASPDFLKVVSGVASYSQGTSNTRSLTTAP